MTRINYTVKSDNKSGNIRVSGYCQDYGSRFLTEYTITSHYGTKKEQCRYCSIEGFYGSDKARAATGN